MIGEYAEVALEPRNVDLIDLARERQAIGSDEIKMERGHGLVRYAVRYAASAASFLPFSTASSMVPTM